MNIIEISSLFIIMFSLALIPSASVALVITRSAMLGISNGIATTLGIVLGDLIFIILALYGLSALAESMGGLFLTLRYLGATYLLWLGITLLRTKQKTTLSLTLPKKRTHIITSFFAGLFLTLGDIKAIFFYLSLLPTFVNLETLVPKDALIIMLITTITVGGVKLFYAFSAQKIMALSQNYKGETALKKIAGCFMFATGGYLIVKT